MAQIIKFKRSTTPGSIPETGSLQYGEIAMNVTDGKVFFRKSGSIDSVETILTTNTSTAIAGNLNLSGSITASFFKGDGSGLYNINAGAIGDLNTFQYGVERLENTRLSILKDKIIDGITNQEPVSKEIKHIISDPSIPFGYLGEEIEDDITPYSFMDE